MVSASDLARLGYCERQITFDARHGKTVTPEGRAAQERGTRRHREFYEEGERIVAASAKKGRCFVATLALGECAETKALRAFRDLYLRPYRVGRMFVHAYYSASPPLCRWLEGRPAALYLVRLALRSLSRVAVVAVTFKVPGSK